jgi:hypothetical protein
VGLITLVEPVSEPVSVEQMDFYLRVDSTSDDPLMAGLITAARRWCENFTQRRFQYTTLRLLMDFFPGYVDFKMSGQKISSPFVSGSNAVLVGIRYAILLPYPAVYKIVNFQYEDENGSNVTLLAATNYIQDLQSQPARLMPLFGQMWPVARVVSNAVTVDYVSGYGGNVPIVALAGNPIITAAAGYTFTAADVGSAISFNGSSTVINSVDGLGNATLAAAPAAAYTGTGYLGNPVPSEICTAIMMLAAYWNENRVPNNEDIPFAVKSLLMPYRDLRL